jgi:malate/lactate dehydrogenase
VPLYDRVELDGHPIEISEEVRAATVDYVDNWYTRHVALDSGRTSTWTSGLGGALMIKAMLEASDAPFPASVELDGEYGVRRAAASVPALLGPRGLRAVVEWPLSPDEQSRLDRGVEHVRAAATLLRAADGAR